MMRVIVACVLVFLAWQCARAEEKVPEWFRFDAQRPYAIFDAWKELSTRKAATCLGENWKVLGGRLVNKQGRPIPHTQISLDLVRGKAWRANLETDANGYFLIYSPFSLELGSGETSISGRTNERSVSATPGYPTSQAGQTFAYKRQAGRTCDAILLMREEDRAFYVFRCDDQTGFDANEFKTFQREYLEQKVQPRDAYQAKPRDPEEKVTGVMPSYDVRVLDDSEKAVPDAILKYQLSGLSPGFQIRKTDAEGRCKLEEWPLGDGGRVYRMLTVDAPGFGVGPLPFEPKPGVENVVRLERPGLVVGRILDDEGNPLACELNVGYKRLAWITAETRCYSQADGTFRFERVMPHEEFRVTASGSRFHGMQWAGQRSDWLSLAPGETSKEVQLRKSQAACLRGIVVSEDGNLVPASTRGGPRPDVHLQLDFGPREDFPGNETISYVGTDNGTWGPNDGRFGFYGLDSRPFRIRVGGWEVDPAEPIQLEPGEMRFIRVRLKKKVAK